MVKGHLLCILSVSLVQAHVINFTYIYGTRTNVGQTNEGQDKRRTGQRWTDKHKTGQT